MKRLGVETLAYAIPLLAAVSCTDSTAPVRLDGTYDLVSIQGRSLPTTLDAGDCGLEYESASLEFTSESRVVLHRTWTSNACIPSVYVTEVVEGWYRVRPNATEGQSITLALGAPYSVVTRNAVTGIGAVDLSGRISLQLREAESASPPVGGFVFQRQ